MVEISQELVERMVALVRSMVAEADADRHVKKRGYVGDYTEAWAIAKLLPKPVDPDLIEARRLVFMRSDPIVEHGYRALIMHGDEDDSPAVQNTLAAIKRGRELQKAEGSHA